MKASRWTMLAVAVALSLPLSAAAAPAPQTAPSAVAAPTAPMAPTLTPAELQALLGGVAGTPTPSPMTCTGNIVFCNTSADCGCYAQVYCGGGLAYCLVKDGHYCECRH
jgi:hypothetical protein